MKMEILQLHNSCNEAIKSSLSCRSTYGSIWTEAAAHLLANERVGEMVEAEGVKAGESQLLDALHSDGAVAT
jgi:hypothetical protein